MASCTELKFASFICPDSNPLPSEIPKCTRPGVMQNLFTKFDSANLRQAVEPHVSFFDSANVSFSDGRAWFDSTTLHLMMLRFSCL